MNSNPHFQGYRFNTGILSASAVRESKNLVRVELASLRRKAKSLLDQLYNESSSILKIALENEHSRTLCKIRDLAEICE
jgi:hypothetical protein